MQVRSLTVRLVSERQIMAKYLVKRIAFGLFSIVAVVAIVMVMIYSLMNRDLVFSKDSVWSHQSNNAKKIYEFQKWEEYGYLDYVTYTDYINDLVAAGEMDEATKEEVIKIGNTVSKDSKAVSKYVKEFTDYYRSKGYEVERFDAVMLKKKYADGGRPYLIAHKDTSLPKRLWTYFSGLFRVDDVDFANGDVGERGISFTLYDPVYGGEKFSPAIIGNGTQHKYLLYFDSKFPYIHQNIVSINLGKSYSVNKGIDVFDTMTASQGSYEKSTVTFPTGLVEERADDLHTATYLKGSREASAANMSRYIDDYTNVITKKNGMSKMGYSFVIGIIATVAAYCLGVPLGILMARKKDKLIDKLGTIYIVFIIAVPSLAYIFMFKSIGGRVFGLPTTFDMENPGSLMYVLPVISLALPSVANLMKWMRRYMIDQMNSDYVKFARSGGLTESEIFTKHIMKNAAIPIVHGIPGSVLGALTGAIITERVYVIPGAGNLLTTAINAYDNGAIVGVTLFYAVLSVVSIIIGDILMSMVDPRISFSSKDR